MKMEYIKPVERNQSGTTPLTNMGKGNIGKHEQQQQKQQQQQQVIQESNVPEQ